MANTRVSAAQRIVMQNVAEAEVMRYAGDHARWHKHVHNTTLDPVQVLKMKEMDQHANTIDYSSRRTGKTVVKELHNMEWNATHADQEIGIVAPREAQAIVALNYHLDSIRRSPILSAWLANKHGRMQMSDTRYEFANRSKSQAYGIMAQVDGGDLTVASLEEVDDMPLDRLDSRFLLMLGSTRRLGASADSVNEPKIRITGVFKGSDTLKQKVANGTYKVIGALHGERARKELRMMLAAGWLEQNEVDIENYDLPVPIMNCVNGIRLGVLHRGFIVSKMKEMGRDEFIRQLLCVNTQSKNLIWQAWVQRARQMGLDAGIEIEQALPGIAYKRRGLISFGYDHSGHGEDINASRYALIVCEQIGNFVCFIYARTWPPGTDEAVVKADLRGLWRYFRPDYAFGDAYGIGLLTQLNDELYTEGLVQIDRRTIGEGNSTASTWVEWAFAPIRFEGMTKHSMAQALRSVFNNNQAVIAYFDEDAKDPEAQDMAAFMRQLPNITAEVTRTSYASYKMVKRGVGDDLFDAAMAALWALITRGVMTASTEIGTITRTRAQLLGQNSVRH